MDDEERDMRAAIDRACGFTPEDTDNNEEDNPYIRAIDSAGWTEKETKR